MTLVDQPGPEGVGGEFRTPDEDVIFAGRFQLSNCFRIELGTEEPPNTAPPPGIYDVHPPSARPIGQSGQAGGTGASRRTRFQAVFLA